MRFEWLICATSLAGAVFVAGACAPDAPSDADGLGGEPNTPDPEKQACSLGADPQKCEGSSNQACFPVLSGTEGSCTRDSECDQDSLCFEAEKGSNGGEFSEGECRSVSGSCASVCSSDEQCLDSEDGRYCNPKTGMCQRALRTGKVFGELCDPTRDECRGTCVVAGKTSECEERCRIGTSDGCGVGMDDAPVACAFFAYDLTAFHVTQGAGDAGICAHLCNCNADCPGTQLCLPRDTEAHRGLCAGGLSLEDSLPCELGGGGAAP